MNFIKPIKITKNIILKCSEKFNEHPHYSAADRIITKVFSDNPRNNDFDIVMHKATLVNSLYNTNIFSIAKIAKYISNISKLDQLIDEGNSKAVDKIRSGHKIKNSHEKEYNFYSFATKYCSFHKNEHYPMYDSLIHKLLSSLNKEKSINSNNRKIDFKNYSNYRQFIKDALDSFSFNQTDLKTVDQGFWMMAKYYYGDNKSENDKWIKAKLDKIILSES